MNNCWGSWPQTLQSVAGCYYNLKSVLWQKIWFKNFEEDQHISSMTLIKSPHNRFMMGRRILWQDWVGQQTTAMDEREREIVRRNHRLLVQNIILTDEFFDCLRNYHVLPETMIKDVKVCDWNLATSEILNFWLFDNVTLDSENFNGDWYM